MGSSGSKEETIITDHHDSKEKHNVTELSLNNLSKLMIDFPKVLIDLVWEYFQAPPTLYVISGASQVVGLGRELRNAEWMTGSVYIPRNGLRIILGEKECKFEDLPELSVSREEFTVTAIGEYLYMIGGLSNDARNPTYNIQPVRRFHLPSLSWIPFIPQRHYLKPWTWFDEANGARDIWEHTAIHLKKRKIIVVASKRFDCSYGSIVLAYDYQNDSWKSLPSIKQDPGGDYLLSKRIQMLTVNEELYLWEMNYDGFKFDFINNVWQPIAKLPFYPSCFVTVEDKILALCDPGEGKSLEYKFETDSWTNLGWSLPFDCEYGESILTKYHDHSQTLYCARLPKREGNPRRIVIYSCSMSKGKPQFWKELGNYDVGYDIACCWNF